MPCNVLQPPTLPPPRPPPIFISLFPSALPLSWSPSSVLLPPPLQPPLWLSPVVAVFDRNSISTDPPLSPTYLKPLPPTFFSTSPTKPLLTIRETLSTRERKPPAAFRAINYAAQLFTGISCLSDYPAPPVRCRYPARRDVNTKTGDFKWSA